LYGYYPCINIGKDFEIDASLNGNILTGLTGVSIVEFNDGRGTNECNINGFSDRQNLIVNSTSPAL